MNMQKRTYEVAGVTVAKDGAVKVRYCGEVKDMPIREKLYAKDSKLVQLIVLPSRMNKMDVCDYLVSLADFKAYTKVIQLEKEKKEEVAGLATKTPQKRGRKPATEKQVKQEKAVKPKTVKQSKPQKQDSKLEVGEVETLEVIEDTDVDDFDIRQFERMASEQV